MEYILIVLFKTPFFLVDTFLSKSPWSFVVLGVVLLVLLLTGATKKELIITHRIELIRPIFLLLTIPLPLVIVFIPGINIIATYIPTFVFYFFVIYAAIQVIRIEGLRLFVVGVFGLQMTAYVALLFTFHHLLLSLLWP